MTTCSFTRSDFFLLEWVSRNLSPEEPNSDKNSVMVTPKASTSSSCTSGTYKGYRVTCWKTSLPAYNGSTFVKNISVSATVAALVLVACKKACKGATSIVALVAGKIVDQKIPTVYYRKYTYEKFLVNPPLSLQNFVVGSRDYTKWYADSHHKTQIKPSSAKNKYQKGYKS